MLKIESKSLKHYYFSNIEDRQQYFVQYYVSHSQQIKDSHREHHAANAEIENAKLRRKFSLHSKQTNVLRRSKRNLQKKKAAAHALARAKCIKMKRRQQNREYNG